MDLLLHKPTHFVPGKINLPGSKSISNRLLIIKALSGLIFDIENLSNSDDTTHLKNALVAYQTSSLIDVGHAGTDMRFLSAFLALQEGEFKLTGSERLQQRPIKDLVEVLQTLGADITYEKNYGYPPLLIHGKALIGGSVNIPGNISSQFITALLLVAPYFKNGLELKITSELVSKPYVDMTITLMKEFGANVSFNRNIITVQPIAYTFSKQKYVVESDWSAASYFYSIVALSPINTTLSLKNLHETSMQADASVTQIYKTLGLETQFINNNVVISKKNTHTTSDILNLNFTNCPDIAQTLVVTCVALNQPFYFTGLQTLTIKETDRIAALKNECEKCGIQLSVTSQSIRWLGNQTIDAIKQISISTYNDHRMAMSFAALSLLYDKLTIKDADVVSKSYPKFWEDLKRIGFNYR